MRPDTTQEERVNAYLDGSTLPPLLQLLDECLLKNHCEEIIERGEEPHGGAHKHTGTLILTLPPARVRFIAGRESVG